MEDEWRKTVVIGDQAGLLEKRHRWNIDDRLIDIKRRSILNMYHIFDAIILFMIYDGITMVSSNFICYHNISSKLQNLACVLGKSLAVRN